MYIDFDEAEALAEQRARPGWAEHSMLSVRLQQAGHEMFERPLAREIFERVRT